MLDNKIIKDISYTRIFARNRDSKAKVIINVGGARSSKSYSIAQLFIAKLVTEEHKSFGICRKTFPALRMTTMKLFIDLLKDYGLYDESKHNKTFNTYEYGTNFIQFFGLDEETKIKSAEFNYIWMEEANEFAYEDFVTLKLRLSGKTREGELNHIYLSLNPVDAHNWIPVRAVKETDVEVIKSTYLDNPFLSKEYVKSITDLMLEDENFYRVYALGEWGLLEGKIYTKYQIIPDLPDMTGAKWAYGLDFGSVAPSAIVKVYLLDGKYYLEEKLYQTGLTNVDIIECFSHQEKGDIYADPTSKMLINEIRNAGLNIFEGVRGVKESIDLCQRNYFYITQNSTNIIKEIQNYRWKKNKIDDNEFLPEPVKYNDHAMDSFRYAVWGITERYGWATRRPFNPKSLSSLHFGQDNPVEELLKRKAINV